jgi:hypothetical protein
MPASPVLGLNGPALTATWGGGQVFSREHKLFDRFAVELLHADDGHGPDMRDASV